MSAPQAIPGRSRSHCPRWAGKRVRIRFAQAGKPRPAARRRRWVWRASAKRERSRRGGAAGQVDGRGVVWEVAPPVADRPLECWS